MVISEWKNKNKNKNENENKAKKQETILISFFSLFLFFLSLSLFLPFDFQFEFDFDSISQRQIVSPQSSLISFQLECKTYIQHGWLMGLIILSLFDADFSINFHK